MSFDAREAPAVWSARWLPGILAIALERLMEDRA